MPVLDELENDPARDDDSRREAEGGTAAETAAVPSNETAEERADETASALLEMPVEILTEETATETATAAPDEEPTPEPVRVELPPEKQDARAILVRLRPAGPWRMGPDSGDRDRVDRVYHSDSLYSAVCAALARMGFLEEWLEATARAVGPSAVRFSSCFPYHANTLYVIPPRNLWPPAGSSKVRWKGATFVPTGVVEALVAGETPRDDGWTIDNECLVPVGAGGGLFRASVRSNAAVDRSGAGVTAHSAACLEFTPQSGLWFLVSFANDAAREQWSDRVKAALRLLADSGFGGKRSSGWGHAEEPEFYDGTLPGLVLKRRVTEGETAHWMLSSFYPAEADAIDWTRGNYTLTTRRGRIESAAGWGELKKPARMVTEGSVLVAAGEPRGGAANVAPDHFAHPVYRAGFAVSIPVPLAKGKASS